MKKPKRWSSSDKPLKETKAARTEADKLVGRALRTGLRNANYRLKDSRDNYWTHEAAKARSDILRLRVAMAIHKGVLTHLKATDAELLAGIKNGADVWGFGEAARLREIQEAEKAKRIPRLFDIVKAKNAPKDGAMRQPYFGAILTPLGAALLPYLSKCA